MQVRGSGSGEGNTEAVKEQERDMKREREEERERGGHSSHLTSRSCAGLACVERTESGGMDGGACAGGKGETLRAVLCYSGDAGRAGKVV